MHKEGTQIVETPVEARQGFLDRPVLAVLVTSFILAAIALGAVYARFFAVT